MHVFPGYDDADDDPKKQHAHDQREVDYLGGSNARRDQVDLLLI